MKFSVILRSQPFPQSGKNEAYLKVDLWNDYSFVTMFDVLIFDQDGSRIELNTVKIGFSGQTEDQHTYRTLDTSFECLPVGYFSLGQDVSYYRKLYEDVSSDVRQGFLHGLKDVVLDKTNHHNASGQEVFKTSLLRSVSVSAIDGQFRRVLGGGAPLTDFNFTFKRPQSDTVAGIDLSFAVTADSTPSTNIHAIIGRNGVGKTTLLNEMIAAITKPDTTEARFYLEGLAPKKQIDQTYFSSLISVAFSAFDPFNPPQEQSDPERGTCYYYIRPVAKVDRGFGWVGWDAVG